MKKLVNKYFPLIIFLLALILRVWKVTEFPAGLNADEAAIGYNAYSLLKTGKDEFGHPWPINFQSFNDYKPGLYFYLVLPFVKIFGLDELAVRLPSVILGSLTVLIVYFLTKKLFNSNSWAATSSFLLAVSPWHLHFSRGGWESNAAVFFMTLGVFFFFSSLEKNRFLKYSVLSLLLAMFTYHSARIVVPLLGLGLVIFNFKQLFIRTEKKELVKAIVLGVFLLGILAFSMRGAAGASRFSGVGLFADTGPLWRVNELRGQHQNFLSLSAKILHNKFIGYMIAFWENYFSHFEGNFLFIAGDEIQRNKVPGMGQLYLIESFFLVLGSYFLLNKRPKNWQVVFWWLMVAPIASALTFQSPHAIRALNMVVPLKIISAYGLWNILLWVKNQKPLISKLLFCSIVTLFLWNFGYYLHQYYTHYPKKYPAAWEYGFKQLGGYLQANENKYQKIYLTNKYDQPYILLAFFLEYPPEQFQKEARLSEKDQYGFSTVENFGKYHFGPIEWEELKSQKEILVIGIPEEIPSSAKIIKEINFLNGKPAFRLAEI